MILQYSVIKVAAMIVAISNFKFQSSEAKPFPKSRVAQDPQRYFPNTSEHFGILYSALEITCGLSFLWISIRYLHVYRGISSPN